MGLPSYLPGGAATPNIDRPIGEFTPLEPT